MPLMPLQNDTQYIYDPGQDHTEILFILPPLFVFMDRDFPALHLGLGHLVSFLKARDFSSRIYNADIYQPTRFVEAPFESTLKRIHRMYSGYSYIAKRWSSYYDRVNDLDNPIWQDLRTVLRKTQPKIVGITSSVIAIPSALVVSRLVREELPGSKVVIGGPAATTCADELIHHDSIDLLVVGEGEETMVELSAFLLGRENSLSSLKKISGLMYRDGSEIIITGERSVIADLDSLPFPDRESMFVLGDNGELKAVLSNADILASRGCPYPCKFCCAFLTWGTRKTRFRSVDNILAEIIYLNRTYGQRKFVFWDDLFTASRKRTIELCAKIIKNVTDIEWVCLVRLNTIDAELLALMRDAGCREIQVGIESGNDRVLNHIGKDLTVNIILEKTALIQASGIRWMAFLIIGFPTETRSEMEETLNLAKKIHPTSITIGMFCPYPGTEFHRQLKEQGRLGTSFMRADSWYPYNNYTGTMDDKEFTRFAIQALKFGDRYNKISALRAFLCKIISH